ncbi:hypothetical protein AEQU2_01906 [Aequorivita lipolytica]|nr:hypothetical protein AEQU2_01906 [Aequorivita lipolytica]
MEDFDFAAKGYTKFCEYALTLVTSIYLGFVVNLMI